MLAPMEHGKAVQLERLESRVSLRGRVMCTKSFSANGIIWKHHKFRKKRETRVYLFPLQCQILGLAGVVAQPFMTLTLMTSVAVDT